MKRIILSGLILMIPQMANAGVMSTILNNMYYNGNYNRPYHNNYYYQDNYRRHYYPRRYYHQPYPYYYNNQQPVIYRNRVKRSSTNNLKYVSDKNDINKLEKSLLGQTYEYDRFEKRLERLEYKLFGAIQSGTSEDRLSLIQNASKNYRAYNPEYGQYNNKYNGQYRPPIFTGSMGSGWKNMARGNFMNQFTGVPTGFTPTMSSAMDPAYMDYFEAERALMGRGEDIDYRTNTGYYKSNTMNGAGAGVRILD